MMSIRPIDLQVMVPKTVDVGKAQQTLKDSSETQQNLLAVQYQQQLHAAKQKVSEKNKSDYIKLENKEEQKPKRDNKKHKRTPDNKKYSHQKNTGHIDITI